MKDLIEALTIFLKYGETLAYPTHCEHDELMVMVAPRLVSDEDTKRLGDLGFYPHSEHDVFYSFRFGSA